MLTQFYVDDRHIYGLNIVFRFEIDLFNSIYNVNKVFYHQDIDRFMFFHHYFYKGVKNSNMLTCILG